MKRPTTVLDGYDHEALLLLLAVHHPHARDILDVTYNKGVMWRKTGLTPTKMDIDPSLPGLDLVGDFRAIPVPDASYDVVVFDPPHLPGDIGGSSAFNGLYNTATFTEGREKDNVVGLFGPFLAEAKRVLRPGGVVLAKLADLVHNHRYQWQQVDFVNAVRAAGLTPCDMLIKRDPNAGKMNSSQWRTVKHLRKAHCYWIVVRHSKRCERKDGGENLAKFPPESCGGAGPGEAVRPVG